MRNQLIARRLTIVAILLIVTACAPVGEIMEGPQGLVKDRAHWHMPLDEFIVDDAYNYALQILAESCMQDAGYDYSRPLIDVRAKSDTVSAGGRNLFTVDSAGLWGYSGAPDPNASVLAAAEAEIWPPGQAEAYSGCLERAHAELQIPDNNQFIAGLALSAWNGATRDPAVIDAAEEWRACMAPLGIPDLPESPVTGEGVPSASMNVAFGLVVDGRSDDTRTPEQKVEEVKVAVFDAECRETSGFSEVLYEAEWTRQVSLVEQNGSALSVLRQAKFAYERRGVDIFRGAGLE